MDWKRIGHPPYEPSRLYDFCRKPSLAGGLLMVLVVFLVLAVVIVGLSELAVRT